MACGYRDYKVTQRVGTSGRSDVGSDAVIDPLAALGRLLVGITARILATLDVDVTLSQYRTIVVLATCGPQRTVDLAAELQVHPSTVTRTCDRLIRRGIVHRHHRQLDRRVSWLALSEHGKDLIGQVMLRRAAEIGRLLEGIPIDDVESIARLLDALVTRGGELPEPLWWRRWAESTAIGE